MAATMDDTSDTPLADQLATEHDCVDDIRAQLISIESMQQTIREQVLALKNNSIDTSVSELELLLPKLDCLQISLRKTCDDAHARPLIQKLHFLDLPDELLEKISEEVRGSFNSIRDEFPRDGIEGIKSLRLTCRRFCDVSSRLLLHRLDVALTNASLNHLDEVSCHPTISKGIRSLRVCAPLYDPTLARSLRVFIRRVIGELRDEYKRDFDAIHSYLWEVSPRQNWESWDGIPNLPLPGGHGNLSQAFDNMGKRNEILLSCTNYLRAETFPPDDDQIMATLSQVHKKYKQLVNDQTTLLRNDTFVTSVAEAVARLPKASILSLSDWAWDKSCILWTEISDPIYSSVRSLLQPCGWTNARLWRPEQHPAKLLYQLPLAVGRAGNPLTELRISARSTEDEGMKLSGEQVRDLVSVAGHLQVLEIDCQLTVQATLCEYQSGERVNVSKFASLFLNGKNLRSVTLETGPWAEDDDLKAEPSIALLPWANLKKISLVLSWIHFDELNTYLEKLMPGTCILLREVHLLSGFWADLLDVIRAKADCHSNVINPEGGEDEHAQMRKAFKNKFPWDDEPTLATAYIRGQISENPLRHRSDQNNMDEEDMGEED